MLVSSPDAKRCLVLIVDNDPQAAILRSRLLESWRFQPVIAAGQGKALLDDAIAKAQRERCQLALVDMRLRDNFDRADESGLDLAARLGPAKVIVVSNYRTADTVRRALHTPNVVDCVGGEEGPEALKAALDAALVQNCASELQVRFLQGDTPEGVVAQIDPDRYAQPGALRTPAREVECLLKQLYAQRHPGHELAELTLSPLITRGFVSVAGRRSAVYRAQATSASGQRFVSDIIKFGPVDHISREVENWKQHVVPFLPPTRYATVARHVLSWDMGVICYSDQSVDSRLPFSHWYLDAQPDAILAALRDLFDQTMEPWYATRGALAVGQIYGHYMDVFEKLAPSCGEFANHDAEIVIREIAVRGGPLTLPNPVVWAAKHRAASEFQSHWAVRIHGDLHGNNIFVDPACHTFIIDYERSGPGYILRDFVELDNNIRMTLVGVGYNRLDLLWELDKRLLAPVYPRAADAWTPIPNVGEQEQAALEKTFHIIAGLRRMACEKAGLQNYREYYWALLMETLISVTRKHGEPSARPLALLYAGDLCKRLELDATNRPWPPAEWAP